MTWSISVRRSSSAYNIHLMFIDEHYWLLMFIHNFPYDANAIEIAIKVSCNKVLPFCNKHSLKEI